MLHMNRNQCIYGWEKIIQWWWSSSASYHGSVIFVDKMQCRKTTRTCGRWSSQKKTEQIPERHQEDSWWASHCWSCCKLHMTGADGCPWLWGKSVAVPLQQRSGGKSYLLVNWREKPQSIPCSFYHQLQTRKCCSCDRFHHLADVARRTWPGNMTTRVVS